MDDNFSSMTPRTGDLGIAPDGSAAWRAEQISRGHIPISTQPRSTPEPTRRVSRGDLAKKAWLAGAWIRAAMALAVLVGGGGVYHYLFGEGAPNVSDAFVDLSAYEYGSSDSAEITELERYVMSLPGVAENVEDFEIREVMSGQRTVAIVMAASVHPDQLNGNALGYLVPTAENRMSPVTLGSGERSLTAYLLRESAGFQMLFTDEDGFVIDVVGKSENEVTQIATEIGVGNL